MIVRETDRCLSVIIQGPDAHRITTNAPAGGNVVRLPQCQNRSNALALAAERSLIASRATRWPIVHPRRIPTASKVVQVDISVTAT